MYSGLINAQIVRQHDVSYYGDSFKFFNVKIFKTGNILSIDGIITNKFNDISDIFLTNSTPYNISNIDYKLRDSNTNLITGLYYLKVAVISTAIGTTLSWTTTPQLYDIINGIPTLAHNGIYNNITTKYICIATNGNIVYAPSEKYYLDIVNSVYTLYYTVNGSGITTGYYGNSNGSNRPSGVIKLTNIEDTNSIFQVVSNTNNQFNLELYDLYIDIVNNLYYIGQKEYVPIIGAVFYTDICMLIYIDTNNWKTISYNMQPG